MSVEVTFGSCTPQTSGGAQVQPLELTTRVSSFPILSLSCERWLPLIHPGAVSHTRPTVCEENRCELRREAGFYLDLSLFLFCFGLFFADPVTKA